MSKAATLAGAPLTAANGSYQRKAAQFRNWISNDADAVFRPEKNRYHLYVSLACPWAHRALITRKLHKLEPLIDVSVVHYHLDDQGWRFVSKDEYDDGSVEFGTPEPLYGFDRLKKLYFKASEAYEGRFTVPVLWDKKLETIVSNESSEIIRMLKEFNGLSGSDLDLYPEALRDEIDEINGWVYDNINNGVYKSGFTTNQQIYEQEVKNVFRHLDKVEAILSKKYSHKDAEYYYLVGDQLTEADIRLYTTIVRFDPVYHQHFKCNLYMIRHDYPMLHAWLRKLYWQNDAFKSTTDFDHIKKHYTTSHKSINPHGIVPLGPLPNIVKL